MKDVVMTNIADVLVSKEFEQEIKALAKTALDRGTTPGRNDYYSFMQSLFDFQHEHPSASRIPSTHMDSYPLCQKVMLYMEEYVLQQRQDRREVIAKTTDHIHTTLMRMFDNPKPVTTTARDVENQIIEEMKRGNKRNANSNKGREAQSS